LEVVEAVGGREGIRGKGRKLLVICKELPCHPCMAYTLQEINMISHLGKFGTSS